MRHFDVHELERKIADVITQGFSPKMDKADAIQAGHDVADMILGQYSVTPHPTDKELKEYYAPSEPYAMRMEKLMDGFDGLIKDINAWAYGKKQP